MKRTAVLISACLVAILPGIALGDPGHGRPSAAQPTAADAEDAAEASEAIPFEGLSAFGEAGGIVYTANEGDASLSTIDLSTGAVVVVRLPVSPHNVDLTPDRSLLLAVGEPADPEDHGSGPHGHVDERPVEGLLVVLDPQDLSAPGAIVDVGSHPAHVVADQWGRAYVSLAGRDEVAVVDLAQGEVAKYVATGAYPHGLRLSPDHSEIYVANVEGGSVSVIDTAELTELERIPVGKAPVQVGFSPTGDRVYVSLRDENRVAVIDTSSREVVARIDVGPSPIQMFATPDGRFVYVANQGTDAEPNDTVSVIDTSSRQVVETLTTGRGVHGVSVSADGAFAFVTNIADDSVSVISVERQEVIATVPVGDRPNGIAFASPVD